VADIWDIISASVHRSDRVDRVKTTDMRVERGLGGLGEQSVEEGGDTCRVTGDAYGVRYSRTVWWFGPQNSDRGSKEERASRGGIKGVRVEAKLSHEGCGGRQMKITSGWTITSSG
jgi:hypothetical protein